MANIGPTNQSKINKVKSGIIFIDNYGFKLVKDVETIFEGNILILSKNSLLKCHVVYDEFGYTNFKESKLEYVEAKNGKSALYDYAFISVLLKLIPKEALMRI